MKKKLLSILLMGVLIIGLTGCGKNNTSTSDSNLKNDTKVNKTDNLEKVEAVSVLATSENYAIVTGKDNETHIIDKDGVSQGTIKNIAAVGHQINNNGYSYVLGESYNKIFDKEGNELFSSKSSESYYFGISPDNYVIKSVKSSDFENGNSYTFQVVDMKGKMIREDVKKDLGTDANSSFSVTYLGENIYVITDGGNDYLYNIKSGKSKKLENNELDYYTCKSRKTDGKWMKCYSKITEDMIRVENTIIKEDLSTIKVDTYDLTMDSKYYYKSNEKSIYDYEGNKIKEVTSGDGLTAVFAKDNKYYVASGTYYYYVMNNKFEQDKEPVKLGRSVKTITKYGIIVNKDSSKRESALYDFDGKLIKDFNNLYAYDPQDFIAKTFIDGVDNNTLPLNLNKAETIAIYK